jgi:hypothetical protein
MLSKFQLSTAIIYGQLSTDSLPGLTAPNFTHESMIFIVPRHHISGIFMVEDNSITVSRGVSVDM